MFYKRFYAKDVCINVVEHLQNTFANVLACWTHVKDRRWLHVK